MLNGYGKILMQDKVHFVGELELHGLGYGNFKYRVSQKKGYPLKSSASAACSNLNALTLQ